jgi:hypothetical protein
MKYIYNTKNYVFLQSSKIIQYLAMFRFLSVNVLSLFFKFVHSVKRTGSTYIYIVLMVWIGAGLAQAV